uniref:Cilia- and flagella-associated protein 45 n=1 Tax=Timema monikensis TaxID=170555 RepID=A0A7R9EED6_9NEOP|nr:unnamed protein product [Timema monikensis]
MLRRTFSRLVPSSTTWIHSSRQEKRCKGGGMNNKNTSTFKCRRGNKNLQSTIASIKMPPSPQIQHIRCLDTKKRKDKKSCEMSEKARSNSKPPSRNYVIGKEKIRLVTQDLIRDLIVPKTEPNLYPAVMEKNDLKRLKNQAKVEQEAKRQALHLLQRAFEMRQEQEDEVKKANRLILGTKCHAIRDAQIAEKKLIILNLDYKAQMAMQLDDLKNQKKRIEEQQKMREELRKVNEQLLYFQDLEREEERIADLRAAKVAGHLSPEASLGVMFLDLKGYVRRGVLRTWHEQWVQEYMKQKAKREAAREEELKLQKMAKEREIARLRALQQRQQDLQAEMDELNAQRIQDEVEREWRKKEREAAKKKVEEDIAMKKARELQIQDRRRMQALEIAREKKEFESVLKVQIESAEKSKLENLKKKNETEAYRSAILKQINEKERERIKCRQELFEEGLVKKREEQLREKHMREIMNKKIDELRQHKVPEVYVKEIEKQLNLV